jgi:hypothetical protein
MIDKVSDTLGWDRKHAIKALNRKSVTHPLRGRQIGHCGDLEAQRTATRQLDPMKLSELVEGIEERRTEEKIRAGAWLGELAQAPTAGAGCIAALPAPLRLIQRKILSNPPRNRRKFNQVRVS